MTLTSAFLVCYVFLANAESELIGAERHMYPTREEVFKLLAAVEEDPRNLDAATRLMVLVDSRYLMLAECLREQFSVARLYPSEEYPKPPYDVEGEFRSGILKEWTK